LGDIFYDLSLKVINYSKMPTQISLLVYKGVPVDFSKYRHTALHALYSDGQHDWLHAVGAHPFFKFQKDSENPMSEPPLAWIPVCTVPDSVPKAKIIFACACTSVRNGNSDRDWNCQNWVGEALTELGKIGCLTKEERGAAIGKMVETILEAELEDVSSVQDNFSMKKIICTNMDFFVHRMGCFSDEISGCIDMTVYIHR
jgi:hypothetical protein